jgi:hypothetical protein
MDDFDAAVTITVTWHSQEPVAPAGRRRVSRLGTVAALLLVPMTCAVAGSADSLDDGATSTAATTSFGAPSASEHPLPRPGLDALTEKQLAYARKVCARLFRPASQGGTSRKHLLPEHVTLYNESGEVSCRDVLDAATVSAPVW